MFSSIILLSVLAYFSRPVTSQWCNVHSDGVYMSLSEPFGVQVQNASYPLIHLQNFTFTPSGGGDQNLFLTPFGTPINNFTLVDGEWINGGIHGVVSTQVAKDGTRLIFFTERTQKLAVLNTYLGCYPDGTGLTPQVKFGLEDTGINGATTCVRPQSGGRWELRYKPANITAPTCIEVKLGAVSLDPTHPPFEGPPMPSPPGNWTGNGTYWRG
ncbi:hypothetical protein RUND412_000192 [Rhizina undulata]